MAKNFSYSGKGIGLGTTAPETDLDIQTPMVHYGIAAASATRRILPRPRRAVLTNLQSGHGWSKQSAQGTQADDTANFVFGSQSLRLVTDGAGSAVFTRKTGLTAANLTGRSLSVWVYVSDVSKLTELWVYASSDTLTNFYTWRISDDLNQIKSGQWQEVTLSFGGALVTGSPTRSAITTLQWRVKDNGTAAVTCNLGGVQSFAEPSAGACTVMFDDAHATVWGNAKPEMDKYGFTGEIAVVPELLGAANYMTLAQCQHLEWVQGWEMCSHSYSHTNQTTYKSDPPVERTAAEAMRLLEEDAQKTIGFLKKNGLTRGAHHFAYPNGGYDFTEVIPVVRRYYSSARTIASYPETIPPANPHQLRCFLVLNTTTTTQIQAAVTRALNNKEWLILVFHQVVTSGANASTQYLAADFATAMADLNTQGLPVKTVSEVLDYS